MPVAEAEPVFNNGTSFTDENDAEHVSQPLAATDGRYGCVPSRSRADLPAKYRVPLYRYHYEGYSFAEVGERLRLMVSTVRAKLARARQN